MTDDDGNASSGIALETKREEEGLMLTHPACAWAKPQQQRIKRKKAKRKLLEKTCSYAGAKGSDRLAQSLIARIRTHPRHIRPD